MKTVTVEIIGTAPLLQHRFGEQDENSPTTRPIHIEQEDPRLIAERNANIAKDGTHYFSGAAVSRLLREAGGQHKQRGSRKSLKYVVPGAVRVLADTITIRNADGGKLNGPVTSCEVDSRPVTIPATKGRVMRHRPRYNSWGAIFDLLINEERLAVEMVHQLLDEGGFTIGFGDFRPEKGGPFGTFRIIEFKEKA